MLRGSELHVFLAALSIIVILVYGLTIGYTEPINYFVLFTWSICLGYNLGALIKGDY